MMNKRKDYISFSEIYGVPIIGYDTAFWTECIETNKDAISTIARNDTLHDIRFRCVKGHEYSNTPYSFFFSSRHCPICISNDDIGAAKCDSEIANYYHDARFLLDDISEHSSVDIGFKCPVCGYEFISTMPKMIRNPLKCPNCKTSNEAKEESVSNNEGFIFISIKK